jgi:hypothetical protein
MALLVTRSECNLLLNSSALQRHGWLRTLLEQNLSLSPEQAAQLPEHGGFFRDSLPLLLTEAKQEWKADNGGFPLWEEWRTCSLCGQTIKKICRITNSLSRQTMIVGDECVQNFRFEIVPTQQTRSEAQARARVNSRREVVHLQVPGLERTLDEWLPTLDTYSVVIPKRLSAPYRQLRDTISALQMDYLQRRREEEVFPEIRRLLGDLAVHLRRFEEHVRAQSSNPLAATRAIAEWLRRNGKPSVLSQLKEEGEVSFLTAPYIREPSLMKYIGSRFLDLVDPAVNAVVDKTDDRRGGYIVHLRAFPEIRLLCDHETVLRVTGLPGRVMTRLDTAAVVAHSILADEPSREFTVGSLRTRVRGTDIALAAYDLGMDDALVFSSRESTYIMVPNLSVLANSQRGLVLGLAGYSTNNLVHALTLSEFRRYSPDELLDIKRYAHLAKARSRATEG